MKVVIVDDNEMDQLLLEQLVKKNPDLELKGVYSNAIEAASGVKLVNPDLILLDVEMPEMNGIEFIKAIDRVPQIILITSHEKYALDAFENDVTDFLVKPPSKERFDKAIDKASQMNEWLSIEPEDDSHIFIRVERENVKLVFNKIVFIEAMSDYVRIQTTECKYLVLTTMKAIWSRLPEEGFIRCHRSFIVNASGIDSFDGTELKMGQHSVPVSRNSKQLVKKALL